MMKTKIKRDADYFSAKIYYDGLGKLNFDFNKGFDALIKADKTGKWIYYAGTNWKNFDYKKGSNALLETKNPFWIYYAGIEWKNFK